MNGCLNRVLMARILTHILVLKRINSQYQWINSKILNIYRTDFTYFLIFRCFFITPNLSYKCLGLPICVGTMLWRLKWCVVMVCACVFSLFVGLH